MRASVLNRLTYTLCFFRASLLLTRALPVLLLLLLLLLPMYYRCITRASCILSPSLGVCVCTIYHRTRAGKSEDEFENYSNRCDRLSCQRILCNRMGYTHPSSNREFFRFFVFLFLSVSVRALWHSDSRVEHNRERERERETKKYNYLFFTLFVKGKHLLLVRGMNSSRLLNEECIK